MADKVWDPDKLETQQVEFDAVVTAVEWTKGKVFREGQTPPDQLALTLRPTSYEGETRSAWYNYSEYGRLSSGMVTKWARFLSALKECGVDLSEAPHEQKLVGMEFHWKQEQEEYEIEGETKIGRFLRPMRLIKSGVPVEGPSAPTPAGEGDLDKLILEMGQGGASAVSLYEAASERGYSKPEVMARMKNLEKAGKGVFEDGVFTSA
jgi:hypothetical protein